MHREFKSINLKLQINMKNYLFPRRFQAIGWVIFLASFITFFVFLIFFDSYHVKMPALYADEIHIDELSTRKWFTIAVTSYISITFPLMTIGLLFIGFSKEKVEDEFVSKVREQSLVWATYFTSVVFIIVTLFVHGLVYIYVPYSIFFVFLIAFVIRFKVQLHRFSKGGEQ